MDSFKRIGGIEIRVAEHIRDIPFTLDFRDGSVRRILDKICQEAGCTFITPPRRPVEHDPVTAMDRMARWMLPLGG